MPRASPNPLAGRPAAATPCVPPIIHRFVLVRAAMAMTSARRRKGKYIGAKLENSARHVQLPNGVGGEEGWGGGGGVRGGG